MRRWVWRALLLVLVAAALTGTAFAADSDIVEKDGIKYNVSMGTVIGPVKPEEITTAKILSTVDSIPITKIDEFAFGSCMKLTSVEMENGIVTIGKNAFNSCKILQTVSFPDSVSTIEEHAFANCVKLNKVVLPPKLTAIEVGTFSKCTGLTSIYISNVLEIKEDAFSGTKVTALHCDNKDAVLNQPESQKLPVHHASQTPGERTRPTCTAQGKQVYTYDCETCKGDFNFSRNQAISATGHTPGDLVPRVEPTCSKTGTTEGHRCTVCNRAADGLELIPRDPNNHVSPAIEIPAVAPTCTKTGWSNGKRCPDCRAETEKRTEVPKLGHQYADDPEKGTVDIIPASCKSGENGYEAVFQVCKDCGTLSTCQDCKEKREAITKAKNDADREAAQEAFKAHLASSPHTDSNTTYPVTVNEITPEHTFGKDTYVVTKEPTCLDKGVETLCRICTVCKHSENVLDENQAPQTRDIDELGHDFDKTSEDYKEEVITPPTCKQAGEKRITGICKRSETEHGNVNPSATVTETIPKLAHTPEKPEEIIAPTCTNVGMKITYPTICKVCGEKINDKEEPAKEIIPTEGHKFGSPVKDENPGEGKADKAPTCKEEGVAYVIVECSVCHAKESQEVVLAATGEHDWGEWKADETDKTKEVRACKVCEDTETRDVSSATPGDSTDTPSGGDPSDDKPSDDDKPGTTTPTTPATPTSYNITLIQSSNGSVSASRSTAEAGDRVTLTVWANSGYELDQLWVTTSGGSARNLTSLGGDQYRFTMPASGVEVRVSFSRQASSSSGWASSSSASSSSSWSGTTTPVQTVVQSVPRAVSVGGRFADVPASHWAAGEINWANQMGYMNGGRSGFDPDGNITFQQMWMVLARLTGSRPAGMEDARRWAVNGGFAEGAAPNGSVSRHQLVTALYRCAHLMGSTNRNTTSLAGYPDSRTVPAVARDAFSWAVANGIIGGNASGRLDPNGTLTRAQFSVILYRFSQRI